MSYLIYLFVYLFLYSSKSINQSNTAYQAILKLGTSPHINAEQSNPVGWKGFQKKAKESEAAPVSTVRSSKEHNAT